MKLSLNSCHRKSWHQDKMQMQGCGLWKDRSQDTDSSPPDGPRQSLPNNSSSPGPKVARIRTKDDLSWETTSQSTDGDQLSVPIRVLYSHQGVAHKTVGVRAFIGIVLVDRVSHSPERQRHHEFQYVNTRIGGEGGQGCSRKLTHFANLCNRG